MTDLTINIMGVKMTPRPPEFSRKWTPMAFIDITIPELELEVNGALLAHQKGKFLAHPPKPTARGSGVQWAINSPLAKIVAEKAVRQYEAMGGQMPPASKPKRQFVPLNELDLVGMEHLPYKERVRLALEEETRCRGAECFTEIWEHAEPSTATRILGDEDDRDAEALAYDAAVAEHAANRSSSEDDTAGLHRVLGINPAVTEACDRAGL